MKTYIKKDNKYECILCPKYCNLSEGESGACLVRKADRDGIYLHAYGKITTMALEPIEKKPIYHFEPGVKVLSIGGFGCNQSCVYCQNWTVSQRDKSDSSKIFTPTDIVKIAIEKKAKGICMTYNEPTMYYEYLLDLAKKAHENGLFIAIKTNAMLNGEFWEEICNTVDVMNIDFKGDLKHYIEISKVDLKCYYKFLDNYRFALNFSEKNKLHVEVSVPIYPEVKKHHEWLRSFVKLTKDIAPNTPVHLLKLFPANQTTHWQVTSEKELFDIYNYIKENIPFVYLSNVFTDEGKQTRNTYDPESGELIVSRNALTSNIHTFDSSFLSFYEPEELLI